MKKKTIKVDEKKHRASMRKLERHTKKLKSIKVVAEPFIRELKRSLRYIK